MAAKLKVFTWSDGFHAFTVAVSSRPKALNAWGIGQDLFKSGLAHEVDSGPARDAALAAPGEVIQTGEAVDIDALPTVPKNRFVPAPDAARKARITALEQSLAAMDAAHEEALSRIDQQISDLKTRRDVLEADQKRERGTLAQRLRTARARL
jgi:hypothetical protein